jgi:hypothetical protein
MLSPQQQQLLTQLQAHPLNTYPYVVVLCVLYVGVMVEADCQPDQAAPCKATTAGKPRHGTAQRRGGKWRSAAGINTVNCAVLEADRKPDQAAPRRATTASKETRARHSTTQMRQVAFSRWHRSIVGCAVMEAHSKLDYVTCGRSVSSLQLASMNKRMPCQCSFSHSPLMLQALNSTTWLYCNL